MANPLPIHGVDISHWQSGSLDFAKAKRAGVGFVIHKATQGQRYTDDYYARRRREVKAAGLTWGAYHYLEPGDARAQARHFMRYADLGPGDLWPVLDYEANGLSTEQFRQFLDECKRMGAPGVILYTYSSKAPGASYGMPLWIARYSNSNLKPDLPAAWKRAGYWMHQFSDGQYGVPNSVPGLGNVDLNTLPKGPASLAPYVWGSKPKPAGKPTRGGNIDAALERLTGAKPARRNRGAVRRAINALRSIKPWKK